MSPLDVQYRLMSCHITPFEESRNPSMRKLGDLIVQAVQNTHADTHSHFKVEVSNLFELSKASERLRFFPFAEGLHNKFLLWHAVPVTSLASVLREGVKLPPPECNDVTFRYGKGIYFTDCASRAVT